jgi:superoxide reductase
MTKQKQIYKCEACGNIVEVLHGGEGGLVCCGQPMSLQMGKKEDEGSEKHVPIIEKSENRISVRVGSQAHPMEEEHYIEWIELISDSKNCKKFLKPGDQPKATFKNDSENNKVRIYCNIHGLWIS